MSNEKKSTKDMRMNKKAVTIRLIVIAACIILCGILTLIIPQGTYDRQTENGHTVIVDGSFHYLDQPPMAVWHWITAPFEALTTSAGISGLTIILVLLAMGGIMVLLDEAKIMVYIITAVQKRFGGSRYKLMYVMSAVMMVMGSTLSFYDQCGIFIPLALAIAYSYNWDCLVGIGLSFLPIAMGFSVSTINPFTIGIPQTVAGLPVNSGIWLRAILLVIMYFIYVIFLRGYINKIEADPSNSLVYGEEDAIRGMFHVDADPEILKDVKLRRAATAFITSVALVVLYTVGVVFVPALNSSTMIVMLILLTLGTFISVALSGRYEKFSAEMKDFFAGMKVTAPAALIIFLIMGVRHIITKGNIMDTLLYYCYNAIEGTSPYVAVFIILAITMLLEFVIGSASAKAYLLLPLLVPLGSLVGLTAQTTVQAYIFGDGFTNAFYPTSNMLLLITGVTGISFGKWYKWTAKLMAAIVVFVIAVLTFCVAIGYGPY